MRYLLRGYLKVLLKLRVYLRQARDTFTPFSKVVREVGELVFTYLQYFVLQRGRQLVHTSIFLIIRRVTSNFLG